MKDSLFVFQNDIIDSNSVTEHASGTNVDFFAVPTSSLTSISALEGKIVLYFRSSNTFENSKANQATVTLNTAVGSESRAAIATWGLTLEEGKIYVFDDTRSSYPGNYGSTISGIDSIVRPTAERFTGSGGSLPTGGVIDQVLTKQSATDGDADWDYPHTLYVTVRNVSGGTLPKGAPVHATDVTGEVADVIAADASNASAMPCTYILNEEIDNNDQGIAILTGTITGVDTSSFSPGDVVYVASGGGFTNVKPTGTNLIQNLGVVTKSNANTGSGVVYGTGRSNDVPNLPTGKFFIGSATNTAESAYTLPTADGSADQFLKTNGSGAVTFTSITQATGTELENVVEDTTPQLGGDLDVNGNAIKGSTVSILGATGELMITATENGPVALRYDNNLKLSTKSDGVNITGELEADSLDIDGNADISGTLNTHTIPSGTGTIALTSDITGIDNVVDDTTPQLGGNLDINGNKIVSTSNGDIDIEPNGTGDVLLGNFKFDADQSVGAGQDDHVLTYDNSTGKISLEAAAGGGDSYIHMYGSANNGNAGADRYIPLGGNSTDTSSIQVYTEGICPFAGVVESITVRTNGAAGSTTTKLWVNGTSVNSSTDTLSAGTPLTIAFGDSVSAGDLIACSMNTTSSAGNSWVTVLIKKS